MAEGGIRIKGSGSRLRALQVFLHHLKGIGPTIPKGNRLIPNFTYVSYSAYIGAKGWRSFVKHVTHA